ncbi:NTP transferase domain-containing protein [Thiomicrorhabdus sp.]|uniref:NTP transferase domain-containing protein n=1 Tax=Thiomicrorhabdus sp. TaxID=2039724 RepID=UPI003569FD83
MIGLVILAGGEGKRMGGRDKGWCQYNGKPFIECVLDEIERSSIPVQVVISANRNLEQYRNLGVPVISDLREGYYGPLAGLEAALSFGVEHNIERWITWPVDCLALDCDYPGLMGEVSGDQTAVLSKQEKLEFAHLSVSVNKLDSLSEYLNHSNRSIRGWLKEEKSLIREWNKPLTHAFNVNSTHQLLS